MEVHLLVTLEDVKNNPEVKELVIGAQKQLDALGYTEHSIRHVSIVSNRAGKILQTLGYDERRVELAKIAGFLHDIGNGVNRVDHAHSGAILAYNILKDCCKYVIENTNTDDIVLEILNKYILAYIRQKYKQFFT